MKNTNNERGYTIVEMLVALVLTGILATACVDFYSSMHNQTLTQEEISDIQQNSRNTLHEMAQTVRMAGYKVGTHDAYYINGDTLYVFYQDTQPVDTVMYYLTPHSGDAVKGVTQPHYLMKRTNSETPVIFTDWVADIAFRLTSTSTMMIALEVQATKADEDYRLNNGYRTFTEVETVVMRNLNL